MRSRNASPWNLDAVAWTLYRAEASMRHTWTTRFVIVTAVLLVAACLLFALAQNGLDLSAAP